MKIATWNVNSIRVRLPHVKDFVHVQSPDVLLLQELKAQDKDIPISDLEDLGYNVIYKGQKAYNGVAILSKHPIEDVNDKLYSNTENDEQARYIECWIDAKNSGFRIASIYL
jgi:exodeoxyribonuclease-3